MTKLILGLPKTLANICLAVFFVYMCLDKLYFKEVLATVVALFWQTVKGGEWQWAPPLPGSKIFTGFKLFTSYKIVTGITRL